MPRRLARAVGLNAVRSSFEELRDFGTSDVVFVTGTNVKYGVWLETGTRKMQPYQWFRPAIQEFERNPEKFIARHTETSIDAIGSADALVSTIALALERRMVQNVTAEGGDRSPGTHPEHPRRRSGNLAGSIEAVRIR